MLYQISNPHGGDVYGREISLDFSANTNPYGTPPGVIKAIADVLPDLRQYPDPYCRRLIAALSQHEALPPEYILCGNGAAELIYAYCEAARPKVALELAPTFSEYSLGLKRVGCRVERYFLKEENDFLPDDGLLKAIEQVKPQAVFLCSPNNPTGQVMPQPLLKAALQLCQDINCRLFLDECFLDLAEQGQSLKGRLASYPGLCILKAFTKSYGMAGVRLGYCLSSDTALLKKMSESVQPWNVSLPAQAAGVAALREQAFLNKARQTIFAERPKMAAGLKGLGLKVYPSCANYLLFHGRPGLSDALLAHKIAIRSCANYYGLGEGWYRTAVRLPDENRQLLAALTKVLQHT